MISCDCPQHVMPPVYEQLSCGAHVLALVAMGMALIDNCDFEELAAVRAELGRWEFQFTRSPIPLSGATGSPVNPIAVF